MCLPALGFAAGMGGMVQGLQIASGVGSLIAQQQQASAQEEYNRRQYENTMNSYRANIAQTNLMQSQEQEAAAQKLQDNNIRAREASSRALVAAGESGVSGMSVDALMRDISFDQGRYNSSVRSNYDRASGAIQNQRENIYADAASAINGLKTPQMPDYFGAALRSGQGLEKNTVVNSWFS